LVRQVRDQRGKDLRPRAHDLVVTVLALPFRRGTPRMEVQEPADGRLVLHRLGRFRAGREEQEKRRRPSHRGPILESGWDLCYPSAPVAKAFLFDLDGVLVDTYEVWFF